MRFALFLLLWCDRYIRMYVPARRKWWHPSSIPLLVSSVGTLDDGSANGSTGQNTSRYGQMGGTERD
ncbi:hypothetical protein [Paenibacillus polymyxa]|uniref:hypothetical protein n=1 Tax=Paenibacillus polymyxa TaxID=1406 RepID=UPI0012BC6900|nr:hypothetical protein [Paenibacillus polymyxa]